MGFITEGYFKRPFDSLFNAPVMHCVYEWKHTCNFLLMLDF